MKMDEIRNTPEQLESSTARSSELQALDDASIEPTSVVERGQNFQSAETIQANLTAAVDAAPTVHEITATPLHIPQSEDGSGKGSLPAVRGDIGQATASDEPQGPPAIPVPLPGPEIASAATAKGTAGKDLSAPVRQGKIINDPLSKESTGEQKSGSSAPASENATAAEPQEGALASDTAQAPKTGDGKTFQQPYGKNQKGDASVATIPGPGRIIPELAKNAKGFIGEGTHGMLDGAASKKVASGKIKGYGPGAIDNTHSTKGTSFGKDSMPGSSKIGTSGGGPAVHGYGPGLVGKTTFTHVSDNKHGGIDISKGESNDSAYGTAMRAWEDAQTDWVTGGGGFYEITDGKNTYTISWDMNGMVFWKSNPINNISPIPYTGSSSSGEKPEPQKIGGKDVESGHYTPLVSIGGKTVSGGGVGGEPGTEWDEGHWYGGLFGSAGRPNDPDNPDYYTPNVLDQADKAKKSSS
jgi:hypothetical protein